MYYLHRKQLLIQFSLAKRWDLQIMHIVVHIQHIPHNMYHNIIRAQNIDILGRLL